MFGVYIQVHIKYFLTFLEAHSLHIFLEIFCQLWPAQASSELGLIYQLWLAQKQPSPAACSSWARLLASLLFVSLLTMFHLVWSWSCSDTFTLCEDAPQNHLQNGWAVVEVSDLVYCAFIALCSPSAQSLTMVHVVWSWSHSDTFTLCDVAYSTQENWVSG